MLDKCAKHMQYCTAVLTNECRPNCLADPLWKLTNPSAYRNPGCESTCMSETTSNIKYWMDSSRIYNGYPQCKLVDWMETTNRLGCARETYCIGYEPWEMMQGMYGYLGAWTRNGPYPMCDEKPCPVNPSLCTGQYAQDCGGILSQPQFARN